MARFWPPAALTAALTLIATSAIAAPRVAVMPVEFEGRVPDVSRISLSERLVEGLARAGFEVSAGDVLKSALHNNPAPETCHAPACYRQIAQRLALQFLVIAQVKIKERNYELKLQLVNGRDGKLSSDERETCELCGISEVGEKLDKLASSLMSRVGERTDPAHVTVQSEPLGASVTVDGRAAGETPLVVELSPGTHDVAVMAEGHAEAHKKIILEPGVRGLVSVDLLPLNTGRLVRASGPPKVFGLITMGVGAAAIAGGIYVLAALDHKPVLCPKQTMLPAPGDMSDRHCYRNARLPAGLLMGGGGVALLTGGLILFVDWGPAGSATAQGRQWMVSARRSF
jgi:TolB-like protein